MARPAADPMYSLPSEQEAARALIQLLQREQQKLVDASVEGLHELLDNKASLVAQWTRLTKSRHAALATHGYEASEAGMQRWIEGAAGESALTPWNALLGLTAEAKELNRINGMLIGRHLVRGQTELNILQGKPQHSNFYGPNGQSASAAAARGLVIG